MTAIVGLLVFVAGLPFGAPCENARVETYQCLTNFFNQTDQRLPPQLQRKLNPSPNASPQKADRGQRSRRQADDNKPQSNHRVPEGAGVTESYPTEQGTVRPVLGKTSAPTFKEEWCGPFAKYVSCMEQAKLACARAELYTCTIMTVFSAMYGTYICDVDISDWVAKDIRSCKATAGLRSDVGPWTVILISLALLLSQIIHSL